mmetsp:Transcript_116619/g.364503  ORF Transcript_116619/g.364503 Transcript_116619/m.364503 type:complete len:298 (+) Transcript_116619:55-948(+)
MQESESAAVEVVVLKLSGDVLAKLQVEPSQKVGDVKQLIRAKHPTHATCWQRLVLHCRELPDSERVGELPCPGPLVLTLVVTVDPHSLLGGPAVAEAAKAFDAMGDAAAPHVARLFTEDDGEPMPATMVEERLDELGHYLRCTGSLPHLSGALLPHAMDVLRSDAPILHRRERLNSIFSWLGPKAAPQLVAWLGLSERPLPPHMRRRAEQLRRGLGCPRVRLAAKAALRDPGGPSVERARELAQLWASLGRNAKDAVGQERQALEFFREAARAALCELKAEAQDTHVRYAAARALRQ